MVILGMGKRIVDEYLPKVVGGCDVKYDAGISNVNTCFVYYRMT